jgi:hypothetical protein
VDRNVVSHGTTRTDLQKPSVVTQISSAALTRTAGPRADLTGAEQQRDDDRDDQGHDPAADDLGLVVGVLERLP